MSDNKELRKSAVYCAQLELYNKSRDNQLFHVLTCEISHHQEIASVVFDFVVSLTDFFR